MPFRLTRYHYAVLTAVVTWLLLIAGGLVTSTDSGLAVPDWPLSFGMWFPPMVGGVLYEHGHRMIAAVVGLMILALAVWVARAEPRRPVCHLAPGRNLLHQPRRLGRGVRSVAQGDLFCGQRGLSFLAG